MKPKRQSTPAPGPAPAPIPTEIESGRESRRGVIRRRGKRQGSKSTILTNRQALEPVEGRTLKGDLG